MKLKVEFYCGLALRLSREKAVVIEVSDDATLRDVSAALTKKFPAFLGSLKSGICQGPERQQLNSVITI